MKNLYSPSNEVPLIKGKLDTLRTAVPPAVDTQELEDELRKVREKLEEKQTLIASKESGRRTASEWIVDTTSRVEALDPLHPDVMILLGELEGSHGLLVEVMGEIESHAQELKAARQAEENLSGKLTQAQQEAAIRERFLAEQAQFEAGITALGKAFSTELQLEDGSEPEPDEVLRAIEAWDTTLAEASALLSKIDFEAIDSSYPILAAEVATIEARIVRSTERLNTLRADLAQKNLLGVAPGSPEFLETIRKKQALIAEAVPVKAQVEIDEKRLSERRPLLEEATAYIKARTTFEQTASRRQELATRLQAFVPPTETGLVRVDEDEDEGADLLGLDLESLGLHMHLLAPVGMPELPVFETIAVLREKGQELSAPTQQALAVLKVLVPRMSFEGLRPSEAERVAAKILTHPIQRGDVKGFVLDAAFKLQRMPDMHPLLRAAVEEVIHRYEEDADYKPQDHTIRRLAQGALTAQDGLMKRTMDLTTFDTDGFLKGFAGETGDVGYREDLAPFELLRYIAVLQAIQQVNIKERLPETIDILLQNFTKWIDFHTELVLKFKQAGKQLSEFVPDDAYKQVYGAIRFLRAIRIYMLSRGQITAEQKSTALACLAEYSTLINAVINSDTRCIEIVKTDLTRKPGDADSAISELCIQLDDCPKGAKKTKWPLYGNQYAFLVTNKIMGVMGHPLPPNQEKNPDNVLRDESAMRFIKAYLAARPEYRKKIQSDAHAQLRSTFEQGIASEFFTTLDQYVTAHD